MHMHMHIHIHIHIDTQNYYLSNLKHMRNSARFLVCTEVGCSICIWGFGWQVVHQRVKKAETQLPKITAAP